METLKPESESAAGPKPPRSIDPAIEQLFRFDQVNLERYIHEGRPLKELVDVDNQVWESMYDFGFRNFQNGQFALAEYWWTQACLFDSARDRNWIALGVACQKQGKKEQALTAFSLAMHFGSTNAWAPLHAAECLMQMGKFRKAESALSDAESFLQNSPHQEKIAHKIALIRRGLKRNNEKLSRISAEQSKTTRCL
ncbi:hypothetical protein AB1K70_03245 [Bremerella sp. JC770]|uniref:hypothetical protein n=1 Tax=Bremerella sp. JC770 TaxID=3232137 RepID=UPI0034594448